jgi:aspartate racemase
MGPEATVELMRRVTVRTRAEDDADHVHLLIESNPKIPSRIAHLIEGGGRDPLPDILRVARNLEGAGAQALAIPCNTAHHYAQEIQAAVAIPLLHMVKLTVARIAAQTPGARIAAQTPGARIAAQIPGARVGVLASTAVHRVGVYERELIDRGLEAVRPRRQEDLMALIRGVKRGETGAQAARQLAEIGAELEDHCEIALIACSELSLISGPLTARGRVLDSLDVLADAIVEFAGATTR